jgi:hypothetical protein
MADEVGSAEEAVVTVSGKGGRPEGDREAWMVKLFVNEAERAPIEEAARRNGEKVAAMLKRLGLAEAERLGIPVPGEGPAPELLERLRTWAASAEGFITTSRVAAEFGIAPARASEALQAAGFAKRRTSGEPIWARPAK